MILDGVFTILLIYAAYYDIKTQTVQNHIWMAIAALSLVNFHTTSILGALLLFVPMLFVGILANLGGGDIKLAGACGLYLGVNAGYGLIIGLIIACVTVPLYCVIKKHPIRQFAFPLVPFMSIGFILIAFLT